MKVLITGGSGSGKSLVRMAYDRCVGIVPDSNILVITLGKYKDIVTKQIPELPEENILLEPYARHTGPCVAYTTYTLLKRNPKAVMAVTPADIIVTVTPDEDSDTSGFILAGKLQPSIIGTVAAFSYEGVLLETGNLSDYAAFNYQISVSNAVEGQQMKLTWNKDAVEIDPLFIEKYKSEGLPIKVQNDPSGGLAITIRDSNYTELIQFYRMPGGVIQTSNDLNIDFEPVETNNQN